jgi:hypothetical protein
MATATHRENGFQIDLHVYEQPAVSCYLIDSMANESRRLGVQVTLPAECRSGHALMAFAIGSLIRVGWKQQSGRGFWHPEVEPERRKELAAMGRSLDSDAFERGRGPSAEAAPAP